MAKAPSGQAFVAKAPVVIVVVATMLERIQQCGVPAYAVDLIIAVNHMAFAAADEGLGTRWPGVFSQEEAQDILKVPAKYKIVALLTLGFLKQPERPKTWKSLNEIMRYETFKE